MLLPEPWPRWTPKRAFQSRVAANGIQRLGLGMHINSARIPGLTYISGTLRQYFAANTRSVLPMLQRLMRNEACGARLLRTERFADVITVTITYHSPNAPHAECGIEPPATAALLRTITYS